MRVAPIHNNFTAGELSPKLGCRVDLAKYVNGLKTCENCVIQPQGGACKRTGFEYIAEAKNSASGVRLVPFIFSETQAYILEFGDQYIRVYKDGGQVLNGATPVEVSTSYAEDGLSLLKFAQTADTLYIAHPDHAPAKLTRTSHTDWTLTTVSFFPPPSSVHDWTNAVTLTPGQITGNGVTFDSTSAIFQTGDVDRQIVFGSSRAIITAMNTTTRVTADIIDDWPDTDPMAPGDWALRGSPTGSVTPNKKEPLGGEVTLTSTLNSFRSEDVGRYVSLHDGFIEITQYTAANNVKGEILKELTDTAASATWTLESADWNATDGYPKAIAFFDNRLFFGGSDGYPSTIWGSVAGDYENHTAGTDDADAIHTSLLSGQVDTILWMVGTKKLIIGTAGAEWWMSGGTGADEVITPSNKMARAETTFGSQDRAPVQINNSVLFIQKPGKNIREFNYNFGTDAYEGKDLSVLADHLTWSYGIDEIAYQQTPNKIVWARRLDGALLGLTYMPEHEIIGWHRHPTSGEVLSIAVIPGDSEHELWAAIKRSVNGSDVRYIERLKATDWLYTYSMTESTPANIVTETWGDKTGADYPGTTGDSLIRDLMPDTNVGDWPTMEVQSPYYDANADNDIIKFSVRDDIAGSQILSATLYLFAYSVDVANAVTQAGAYRVLQDWEETEVCWNSRKTGTAWNTAGCESGDDGQEDDGTADRKATAEDTLADISAAGWCSWDIKDLVQKWVDGTAQEYGVLIKAIGGAKAAHFRTRESTSATQRPYLEICYRPAPASVEGEYTNEDEAFYVDCGLTYLDRGDISAINAASPALVIVDNTVTNDDQVYLYRIQGMTELNGSTFVAANATNYATGTEFELTDGDGYPIDARGYTPYASGGYCEIMATVISGLDHLEGETVAILADGEAQAEQTVSGGQITLSAAARHVHAGLAYTPVIETLRIEAGAPDGTAQAKIKKIHEISARYLGTKNFQIGPDADHLETKTTEVSTEDEDIESAFPGGYNRHGRVYVTQDEPQPMTLLGLMPRMNVGDG